VSMKLWRAMKNLFSQLNRKQKLENHTRTYLLFEEGLRALYSSVLAQSIWKVMKLLRSLKPRMAGSCVACLACVLRIRAFSEQKHPNSFEFKNKEQRLSLTKMTPVGPRDLT
jgi:hypothetical protein